MDAMLTSGRYLTLIVSLPAACGSKRNRADKREEPKRTWHSGSARSLVKG